eukprot:CAMPEP_0117502404 /NCGR_PEP_ID=MMETSP0784-20121206/23795_1 /TAXON_ID=39447 /ORGANISM="" /LENGTH=573 /DNA_ID=CAMNT_0005297685 /DNA_START=32 /DNA_END=1753 /DNA_ORIENTATION=-
MAELCSEPSDDEDQAAPGERRDSAGGASATAAAGAVCKGTALGGTRLGLQFSGGTGVAANGSGALSWKEGRFSDWPVKVGSLTYHLHAFLLARASSFFNSHISVVSNAELTGGTAVRGSDLTDVLPVSCHAAFEDALDFIYSENQAGFEAAAAKALLLLKIADILGISGLFEAMGQRIESAFADTAPLLLDQYCRFHIPGTDDGVALQQLREGAVELVVRKFQPFLANPEMRSALLRLPDHVLVEILEADDLLVASEDVVFDFVVAHAEAAAMVVSEGGGESPVAGVGNDGKYALWRCVRWPHVSAATLKQALTMGQRLTAPEVVIRALTERISLLDLGSAEMMSIAAPAARHPVLPPGVPPPSSIEIDFCFHYGTSPQFASGEALRSQPKRVGDLVLRVLVFPCGTDTGVAHGSLSVFLEAVPQPHWPRDWEFNSIRYALACLRWPCGAGDTWAAKRKSDLWTFKANRLDRGWHDFLSPGEVHRYLGPEGFVCLRGSLDHECLARAFLFSGHGAQGGYAGPGAEAAGSSASRRTWAPPRLIGSGGPNNVPGGSLGSGGPSIGPGGSPQLPPE